MKLKFQLLAIFLLLISFQAVEAQKLARFIPADAGMVFGIDFGNLSKKADWDKIRQMEFFKEMMKESTKAAPNAKLADQWNRMMNDASTIGVSTKDKGYLYMTPKGGKDYGFGLVFAVSDQAKFSQFMKDMIAETKQDIELKKAATYQYMTKDNMAFAWNGEVGMFLGNAPSAKAYNQDKNEAVIDGDLEIMLKNAMMGNPMSSILKKKSYAGPAMQAFDMNTWLDYELIMKLSNDFSGLNGANDPTGGMMNAMQDMYKDTYVYMDMDFEKGSVDLGTKYFMSNEMTDLWKGVADVKMNKNFSKYIPAEGLLGYWGMAYNIENMVAAMKEMGAKMLGKDMPNVEEMVTESLHKMGVNMDDKSLFKMMKGDAVFALTGVNEVEREVVTFEYDEDFNKTEVKKMVSSPLPEFVVMMSYNNKNDLMKLISKGEEMGMLEKKGDHYLLKAPGTPVEVKLAMHNDIMFLTNNDDLLMNKLKKGYPKKQRIGKQHRKMLKKNAQVMYWNISESIKIANAMDENLDRQSGGLMNVGRQNFESLVITSPKKIKDHIDSTMRLNLSNKKEYSIDQLFRIMNDFYVKTMRKNKSM